MIGLSVCHKNQEYMDVMPNFSFYNELIIPVYQKKQTQQIAGFNLSIFLLPTLLYIL